VSTVSYAGPRLYEIADRLPRARAQHAAALQRARDARSGRGRNPFAAADEHVSAMRAAAWARTTIAQLLTAQRALDTVWFDRRWFYFDDPELARRQALMPAHDMPRYLPARSRGEDDRYIQRRQIARRAARRARRTPEQNAALDAAAADRAAAYFEQFDY
jgi:hypothetical protein